MRVLVTGASGFIGRNLVSAAPRDWDVTAVWRGAEDFPAFVAGRGLAHVRPVRVDLAADDPATIAARVGDVFDAAVCLAANGDPARSVAEPRMDLAANALSLVALLERVKIGRVVFVSSGAVYDGLSGHVHPGVAIAPRLPYAISKLAAEHYLRSFVARGQVGSAVAVRFFGAFGPHEPERKIYTKLVRAFAIERRNTFTIRGDGKNLIDAMYVDDAVRGLKLLLGAPAAAGTFETIDFASGTPTTIADLARTAAATFGIEPEIALTGHVPEYIEFRSVDRTMLDRFGFAAEVSLAEGLRRLAAHLGGPS
ncbi:MAG: NAD-dependent epimerase/dehydratase family protein [Candidatus Eisenbacteria bacterium]|nr:NAD-dependent epimerase/dehydratase family protein [Candidatus Eisenbacteria bacterium]